MTNEKELVQTGSVFKSEFEVSLFNQYVQSNLIAVADLPYLKYDTYYGPKVLQEGRYYVVTSVPKSLKNYIQLGEIVYFPVDTHDLRACYRESTGYHMGTRDFLIFKINPFENKQDVRLLPSHCIRDLTTALVDGILDTGHKSVIHGQGLLVSYTADTAKYTRINYKGEDLLVRITYVTPSRIAMDFFIVHDDLRLELKYFSTTRWLTKHGGAFIREDDLCAELVKLEIIRNKNTASSAD